MGRSSGTSRGAPQGVASLAFDTLKKGRKYWEPGAEKASSEGNLAKRRLLVKPYRPEIRTEFANFLGESDQISGGGGFQDSPPDRYAPNSSLAI